MSLLGSLWSKWDLHVHTPESIINGYGGNNDDSWEKWIQDIEKLPSEFKVLGINDYYFLDGYRRVLKEQSNGRMKNISLFLPVIELRVDKFAGVEKLKRVNLHVVFSNELKPDLIQSQFVSTLSKKYQLSSEYSHLQADWCATITKDSLEDLGKKIIESVPDSQKKNFHSPLQEGFNNFNCSFDEVMNTLETCHYFQGKYVTAIGKTEWADLNWSDNTVAEKKSIINRADIVFTSALSVNHCLKSKDKLTEQKVKDILLDCSDAHHFSDSKEKDRIGKCFTWIKADTTFNGLKRAIKQEPGTRVFIGNTPEKQKVVDENKTKYIKSIQIRKNTQTENSLTEIWFDSCYLEFNSNLIAIIGNKGSGKSAIADVMALCGNAECDEFSFLTPKKFYKDHKADSFEAKINWESNEATNFISLSSKRSSDKPERVKYIPQQLFEKLCNEEQKCFHNEIQGVIFSHVDKNDHLGCSTLSELIDVSTEGINSNINSLRGKIKDINRKICELESKCSTSYKLQISENIKLKNIEIHAHEQSCPTEVHKPENSEEESAKINSLREKKESLSQELQKMNTEDRELSQQISTANKLLDRIVTFQKEYVAFQQNCLEDLLLLGLKSEDITYPSQIAFEKPVEDKLIELKNKKDQLKKNILDSSTNMEKVGLEIQQIESSLQDQSKLYQLYLSALENWKKIKEDLVGSINKENSLKYFENLLQLSESSYRSSLKQFREQRDKLVQSILAEIHKITNIYKNYHKPVQNFIDNNSQAHELGLNFEASISIKSNFITKFFEIIARNRKGFFKEEGEEFLYQLIQDSVFDEYESVHQFIQKILSKLSSKNDEEIYENIKNQIKPSASLEGLYDFLFSLDYLETKYRLKLKNKSLEELSPGEKGALLLVFYLLVDRSTIPLIIDQPEENLDNQSITALLVPSIKDAKTRRQIFMVTHNPNLAVVCDAEQVVYASIDKLNGNKVHYETGSIESDSINKRIIDILEGTKPAFDRRRITYSI